MDSYINLYTNTCTGVEIYLYIGWNTLREYENVPDNIWKQICDNYCQDMEFRKAFETYWLPEYVIETTYKELFLCFINSQLSDLKHLQKPSNIVPVLFKNRDFVLLASKYYIHILYYADIRFRSDREIILKIANKDLEGLTYMSQELREDKEFMRLLDSEISHLYLKSVFEFASDNLKSDKEFVLEMVKKRGSLLYIVDNNLKSDKEVVLTAVRQNTCVFQYASDNLKSNREFIFELVEYCGLSIQYASQNLKADREIALRAIKQNPFSLRYLDDKLKADREIVLIAIRGNGNVLEFVDNEFKRNQEVVFKAIKQNGDALKFVDEKLKNDPKFMMKVIRICKNTQIISNDPVLRTNKELIRFAHKYNMKYL